MQLSGDFFFHRKMPNELQTNLSMRAWREASNKSLEKLQEQSVAVYAVNTGLELYRSACYGHCY